jgi:hypothetical protein
VKKIRTVSVDDSFRNADVFLSMGRDSRQKLLMLCSETHSDVRIQEEQPLQADENNVSGSIGASAQIRRRKRPTSRC